MENILKKQYFVYALVDENNKYFYIGKGNKNRLKRTLYCKNNNYLKQSEIKKVKKITGKYPTIKVLVKSSEEYCFDIEKKLIKHYGKRIDNSGILCNMSDGGDGAAGLKISEKRKQQLSIFMKKNNPMQNPEYRKKVSESKIGSKNPMYGRVVSDEERKKTSMFFSGKNHPLYGKPRTKETKEKISKALKGRKPVFTGKSQTPEHIEKIRNSRCKNIYTLVNSEGVIFQTKFITSFSKKFFLNPGHIYQVIKGKETSHKGWKLVSIESS